jgi:hypothetical protein
MDAAQEDGQRVLTLGDGDEVYVVGHEAVREHGGPGPGEVLADEAEIGGAVLGRGKSFATADAPLGDVARNSRDYTTVPSWHMLRECGTRDGVLRKITQFRLTRFTRRSVPVSGRR